MHPVVINGGSSALIPTGDRIAVDSEESCRFTLSDWDVKEMTAPSNLYG
jgi:hypothetical protein